MGYYIEVPERFKKATQLVKLYKGEIIPCPKSFSDVPEDKALICIVDNRAFEAAGYCFDSQEFGDFKRPDGRPRTWLLMNKALVHKLTGYKGE